MAIVLNPDFREFLKSLNDAKVEYLLIGGFAVGYHGYPRATSDLDVWIAISPDNARRVVAALREFGFGAPDLKEDLFLREKLIFRMGVEPIRIEISTKIDGVVFEECWSRRIAGEMDGLPVPIISRQDLLKNKRASGRHKDLDDVEQLERQ